MLTMCFKRVTTIERYYSGFAGPYLDEFANWLKDRGYKQKSVRRRVQGAMELGQWAEGAGFSLNGLPQDTVVRFRRCLKKKGRLFTPGGKQSVICLGAGLFFRFVREKQGVTMDNSSAPVAAKGLVVDFEQWMQTHRGTKTSTLGNYRRHLNDLVGRLGKDPDRFQATQLRDFVLQYAKHNGLHSTRTRVKALRAFVRFLIATGRCEAGLESAVPTIAEWKLSALPRYLPPDDVEKVIAGCSSTSRTGIRDKAIILLLARLGLRASEVAGLTSDTIDWSNGTLSVVGKDGREARLPLPQEVGDAILHYIESGRPPVNDSQIFISAIAPWRPITRYVVKAAAGRAIRRAGINSPAFGAHIFRHSAATELLRNGASLHVIGEVLRHRHIDMTAHYAKVDIRMLGELARPWPVGRQFQ